MADIVLKGNTSGSITIASPDVSGVNVLTLPVETGTILTTNTPLPEVSSVEFAGAGTSSGNITITAPDTDETNTLTLPESTGTFATENSLGMRNLIINGNMQIAQRATSATVTAQGYYTVDRWRQQLAGGGTYTQAQTALTSSNAPFADGFSQSIKYDCTTTYTGVDSFVAHRQIIEGQNLQQLAYGTSSAKSLTLSFWVKSNVTGTAIANLYSVDSNKQIGKTYTIDVANTWEYKTVTFAGDTSSSFDNDNAASLYVNFVMSVGTNYTSGTLQSTWTNFVNADFASGQTIDISASTSNEISFTGVQLEAGTTATPFENLQYTTQIQLCQRYYQVSSASGRSYTDDGNWGLQYVHKVEMRTSPTIGTISGGNNDLPATFQGIVVANTFQTGVQWSGAAGTYYTYGSRLPLNAEL